MENRKEHLDKMAIKIKVLESKIQKLEEIADEVVNELKAEYQQHIKELYLKKDAARQELLKIKEIGDRV
jgi:RNA-binding protein YhbY